MKIITLHNQKGGVGKTTIATHLAWHLGERHHAVLLELDAQGNASDTLLTGYSSGKASQLFDTPIQLEPKIGIDVLEADDRLLDIQEHQIEQFVKNVKKLNVDYVIIDTPPALNAACLAGIKAADYIACPIQPERYSITGLDRMLSVIAHENEDVNLIGLIVNHFNSRSAFHKENIQEIDYFHILNTRSTVAESSQLQKPVWSLRNVDAAKEFRSLCEKLEEAMA